MLQQSLVQGIGYSNACSFQQLGIEGLVQPRAIDVLDNSVNGIAQYVARDPRTGLFRFTKTLHIAEPEVERALQQRAQHGRRKTLLQSFADRGL